MFRSRAGQPETLREAVNEGRRECDPSVPDSLGESLVSDLDADHTHNAHWLEDKEGGPSRYVAYYDAASLYPSSG